MDKNIEVLNKDSSISIISADSIKDKIYTIRGVKVMLDMDLAEIYGYTTKAFNQQVRNNIEKFDEDFMFHLTKDEVRQFLRSNFLTLEQGKYSKYLPHAFTEQGIYMLMTVLRGELATKQSKALIRIFKDMKDFILENRTLLDGTELAQLSLQTAQNTADIAQIKETMVTKDCLMSVINDFCGASSKDAGNKINTITKIADCKVYHQIIDDLMKNPVLVV